MPQIASRTSVRRPRRLQPARKRLCGRAQVRSAAWVFAVALPLVLCVQSVSAGQPKDNRHENRREIDQLEEVWRNAMLKSDTAAMGALLAEDYIGIRATGTLQSKDDMLANLRTGRVHVAMLNVSDRKVRFYGKTALVTSLAEVEATTPDGDVSGSYRYTRVYARNPQGQWKVVSFEASQIRSPGARR